MDRRSTDTLAGGVAGLSVHDVAILRSIKLGDTEIRNVPAIFNRGETEVPVSGALLGIDVFVRFRLITDYAADGLYLQPNAAAMAQEFPKDRTGLRAGFDGDHLQVVFVSKEARPNRAAGKRATRLPRLTVKKSAPTFPTARWRSGRTGLRVPRSC